MYFKSISHIVTSCMAMSVILGTLITDGEGLQIKDLKVPDAIKNGSETAVVLDCDYSFDEESRVGLVVKWFFNQNPTPVYQWIPSQKPQDLGVLKGKLNLDYRASDEEHKMHRALQILNPTTELSGEYKCLVSTFDNEESQSKKMIIYVPGRSLQLTQTKQNENTAVNISCAAEGVFPEPKLTIVGESRTKLENVHVVTVQRNGLYDIYASLLVDDDSLESDEDGNTFECELQIPEANFTTRTTLVYVPGPPTTTTPEPPTSEMPESNLIDSNTACRSTLTWLLLLPLTLCLRL